MLDNLTGDYTVETFATKRQMNSIGINKINVWDIILQNIALKIKARGIIDV